MQRDWNIHFGKMEGREVKRLMRVHHKTIRELSKIMGMTMKRIRQIREWTIRTRFGTGFKRSLVLILAPSNPSASPALIASLACSTRPSFAASFFGSVSGDMEI